MDKKTLFAAKAALLMIVFYFAGILLVSAIESKYRIGIDVQKQQCLPWKYFLIELGRPSEVKRGQILVAITTYGRMGHRFDGQWITKMAAAIPGDHVAIKGDQAYVNGRPIGLKMDLLDKLGKRSGDFDREFNVPKGHYLLLGTQPRSYDGRYWGLVPENEIIGRAKPIW